MSWRKVSLHISMALSYHTSIIQILSGEISQVLWHRWNSCNLFKIALQKGFWKQKWCQLRPWHCSSGTQLHSRHVSNQYCLEQDALKGEIPEHLDVFSSTMSQQHGYDYTLNSYMSKVSRPRGEWGKNKTYYNAINDF